MAEEIFYELNKGENYDKNGNILKNWINTTNLNSIRIVDDSENLASLQNLSQMFSNTKIKEINLSQMNTSNVINMFSTFANSRQLTSISNFDTSNVKDMSRAFYYCFNLIEIPNYNMSNVVNMSGMFYNCFNLINVPQFYIPKVTNMLNIFYNCNNLSINSIQNITQGLPNFDTLNNPITNNLTTYIGLTESQIEVISRAKKMNIANKGWNVSIPFYNFLVKYNVVGNDEIITYNFNETIENYYSDADLIIGKWFQDFPFENSLKPSINVISNIEGTESIQNFVNFFKDSSITTICNFNTSHAIDMSGIFYNCDNLIAIPNLDISNVKNMLTAFQSCDNLITIPNLDTSNVKNMGGMLARCNNLTIIPNFNTINVTGMGFMFGESNNLIEVPNFNTTNATDMHDMFSRCHKFTTIPNFNTINVVNMSNMFSECENLVNIFTLDTSNVRDISGMFYNCNNLTEIPNFNTNNVINMAKMFASCNNLTTIPNFNTSKVTDMGQMLSGRIGGSGSSLSAKHAMSLTEIPDFDTSNVTNMEKFCYGCNLLTQIPNFNTQNVINFEQTFGHCHNLTSIPEFNTQKAQTMALMFRNCIRLTTIPNFNTSSVTNMYEMFSRCNNLTTVPNFNTNNVRDMSSMFSGCVNLTMIPNFNTNNVINMVDMFASCENLSALSYANICNSLPLATNLTNVYIANIGLNIDKFTSEQINILANKGYLDCIPEDEKIMIYFNANGGTFSKESDIVRKGNNYIIPNIAVSKFAHTFTGWLYNNTVYHSGETISNVTQDITLIAQFESCPTVSSLPYTSTTSISTPGEYKYFKFTPSIAGSYKFYSEGSIDTYGYLYDSTGKQLTLDDDNGNNNNFSITYSLEANQEYYFAARFYDSSSQTGNIEVHLEQA